MIEKQFVLQKKREFLVQEYLSKNLPKTGYSHIAIKKTPLGEKIIVYTSRPGLVVGRKGDNIARLTRELKDKFKMENPQIEVAEIDNPNLNPKSVADRIVSSFERFGPKRFKSIGYRALQNMIDAGALGAEVVISGRGVPGSRAKSWRFSAGHLKKSGYISESVVNRAISVAELKSGVIGIKVSLLPPNTILPDSIKLKEIEKKVEVKEIKEPIEEEKKKENGNTKEKRTKTNEQRKSKE